MKVLKNILYKVSIESVIGNTDRPVAALQYDSRNAVKDDVFIAIKGSAFDGHEFISKAISQGVTVVVCQELPVDLVESVTYVVVLNSAKALAIMASNYYGWFIKTGRGIYGISEIGEDALLEHVDLLKSMFK